MQDKQIDNLREAMGTLPNQAPEKNYDYANCLDTIYTKMVEWPDNPYRMMVRMAASTWGDGATGQGHGSTQKWEKLTPENRFRVALSVLTNNTLPVPAEAPQFVFEFNGVPRHTFDQFARMRLGSGHASIGCRDNNKLDVPFVLYPGLFKALEENPLLKARFESWVRSTKNLYEDILDFGSSSWQEARAVLPMSYSHSWTSYINFLAFKGQCGRRLMACEEAPIVLLFWKMRAEIESKFPLLANYCRPVCDNARKCVYTEGPEGLTKLFSNLFAGCGRWPDNSGYSEFNRSCTSYEELEKYVHIVPATGWKKFGLDDFHLLEPKDKELFNE